MSSSCCPVCEMRLAVSGSCCPACEMRLAREMALKALPIGELPPDAEVEIYRGPDGVVVVRASARIEGTIAGLRVVGKVVA